jgi:cold shock CspA family protein
MAEPGSTLDASVGEFAEGTLAGRVDSFDDPRGYGTVRADDGRGPWFFHCTAIADGTRTIEVGASVTFEVVAGHLGHYEAIDLRPA